MRWSTLAGALAGAALVLVAVGRARVERRMASLWEEVTVTGGGEVFRPEQVEELPEAARRFLLRSMEPGTPLPSSVELRMRGEILLRPDGDPLPMAAEQVLAPPVGFVWRARAGRGALRIEGFDAYGPEGGEMRWALWGLVPVMRASGEDVTRSAAGRLAMEAVFVPSTLLPGRGVAWEEVDEGRARFRMTVGRETVVTTVEVDPEGRPRRVSALRWSGDAGPGYAPFVAELQGELEVGGIRIPAVVEAGWRLGEPDEFRFFRATLQEAVFR